MTRRVRNSIFALLVAAGWSIPHRASAAISHPRLLVTSQDVAALRQKVADGGDDDRAWQAIQSRWPLYRSAPLDTLIGGPLAGSNVAAELGLLALLEHNGIQERKRLAQMTLYLAQNRAVDQDDFASSLRLRTLALGYDMSFDPADPQALAAVRTEIQSYLAYMPTQFNYYRYAANPYVSNRGMMVGASMGLAAIAIWDDVAPADLPAVASALQFAAGLVDKCFTELLDLDGAYREGVLYGAWTMRMAIPYIEARRRFDSLDLATNQRLERFANWLAYEVLPEGGGLTNNLNDSSCRSKPLATHATYLDWAQTRYGSSVARWTWEHVAGAFGGDGGENADRVATVLWNQPLPDVDPAQTLPHAKLFADRGLYFYRSAWKTAASGDEMLFSLQAGRFHGGHAQEDQGQFTLYANGERWALDNGPAYPTMLPKDTQSHNLILVDGLGEHNAGNSIGTDATLAAPILSPWCDWLQADLATAYATHSPYNDPNVPFPGSDWSWGYDGGNPLERADRLIAVVKEPPTWIFLADDFRKDGVPHTWEWLLHTDVGNRVDLGAEPCNVEGKRGGGRLLLQFANPRPSELELTVAPYEAGGEDPETQRIVARVQAVEPHFVVALVPMDAAGTAPVIRTSRNGGLVSVRLQWGAMEDWATSNCSDSLLSNSDSTRTDAKMTLVRTMNGDVVRYLVAAGTVLRHGNLDLASFDRRASASWSDATLYLSDHDLHFVAYAPGVQRVVGPAGEMRFERQGDWVHDATTSAAEVTARRAFTWVGTRGAMPVRIDCVAANGRPAAIAIHDVRGRLVRCLPFTPGASSGLLWDGTDGFGNRVAAGVYLVQAPTCGDVALRRIVLLP